MNQLQGGAICLILTIIAMILGIQSMQMSVTDSHLKELILIEGTK